MNIGEPIAIAYYKSTTKKNVPEGSAIEALVKSGRPICIVELNQGDKVNFNDDYADQNRIKKIQIKEGLNLFYFDTAVPFRFSTRHLNH